MTNEEAIKNITNDACRCCKTYFEKCDEKEDCAYYIATEALNKQIPKKPYFEGDGYSDGQMVYDVWRCPNCDKAYEVDYDDYDYCPNCGQKIDWSEVSE